MIFKSDSGGSRSRFAVFSLVFGLIAALAPACVSDPEEVLGTDGGPTDAAVDAGRAARGAIEVVRKGCIDCHQSPFPEDGTMRGQTSPRRGTKAYPANLTPDVETGLGTWTDDQIVRAMRLGIDKDKVPLCFTMPRFDLSDELAYDIAIYLRTLPPVHHEIPESTCPPLKPRPDAGSPDAGEDDAAATDSGADAADGSQ
jgi:cytochrome c